jgi:hypothetical protein
MNLLQSHTPQKIVSTKNVSIKKKHLIFVTNPKYNSGISEPNSGVQIMLTDKKNNASLHKIEKFSRTSKYSKERFNDGSIDNIEVFCNLDDVKSIWVFPESGTWNLDTVYINDGNLNLYSKFECNEVIGTNTNPALMLTSRNSDILQCDINKKIKDIEEYNSLKKNLILTNISLVSLGTLITLCIHGDITEGKSFLFGGLLGILYLFMLQTQTDLIGSNTSNKILLFPFASPPVRLLIITYVSSVFISTKECVLLPYTLGFFMYKLSVILDVIFII